MLYSILILYYLRSNSRHCTIHDLVIEYLRQPLASQQSTEQYFITLNQNLIKGYSETCNGKWSSYPFDDYYYQYLMDHALHAENHETIQELMRDFQWMNTKFQIDKTLYNLRVDLQKAIDYLKNREIKVHSIDI